jgi:hypothetical protein
LPILLAGSTANTWYLVVNLLAADFAQTRTTDSGLILLNYSVFETGLWRLMADCELNGNEI